MANETKSTYICTDAQALAWLEDGALDLESKAIACLYRRLLDLAKPWVYSRNGNLDDVHDAVSEAVIKFVQNCREGKYRHEGKLENYLFRMAQYKYFDLLRERGNEVSLEQFFPAGIPEDLEEAAFEKEEKEAEASARHIRLEQCLEQIGEKCKERIVRFWYMNQSHDNIAAAMGDSGPNVSKTMKNRCQDKLEKCVKGQQEEPSTKEDNGK